MTTENTICNQYPTRLAIFHKKLILYKKDVRGAGANMGVSNITRCRTTVDCTFKSGGL